VSPSDRSCCSSAPISRRSVWFMPAVGSSSSSSRGRIASARAISTRRWVPYDNSPGRASSRPVSRVRSTASRTAGAAGPRPHSLFNSGSDGVRSPPSWMFSRTVRSDSSRTVWNVRATPRRATAAGGTLWNSSPSSRRCPRVSGTSREIAPSSVLLPEPFGPMIPKILPGVIWNEMPSTALTPPKYTATSRPARTATSAAVSFAVVMTYAPRSSPPRWSPVPPTPCPATPRRP
jgi:hypothetical protein